MPRAWATPIPMSLTSKRIAAVAARPRHPPHRRQHLRDALSAPPHRSTGRTSSSTRRRSSSAATARSWAASSSTPANSTGRRTTSFPGHDPAEPVSYHGVVFSEAVRQSRLSHEDPHDPPAGPRAQRSQPVQRLPAPAGTGDALAAGRAPCGKRPAASSTTSSSHPQVERVNHPSLATGHREPRALQESTSPNGRGVHLHL